MTRPVTRESVETPIQQEHTSIRAYDCEGNLCMGRVAYQGTLYSTSYFILRILFDSSVFLILFIGLLLCISYNNSIQFAYSTAVCHGISRLIDEKDENLL